MWRGLEPGVGVAEVGDGVAAGIFGRRVGYCHVFFSHGDVALGGVSAEVHRALSSGVCVVDMMVGGCWSVDIVV